MRSRQFVCDMDDGVLRIEDSRKAAVEQLRHLHGAPKEEARTSGLDAAIELLGGVAERELRSEDALFHAVAVAALVESLLARGADADLKADAHVQRLADPVQADCGFAMGEIWLVRSQALLAHAHGDDTAYQDFRDRYRAMATSLSFEGHMKWAEAMP